MKKINGTSNKQSKNRYRISKLLNSRLLRIVVQNVINLSNNEHIDTLNTDDETVYTA